MTTESASNRRGAGPAIDFHVHFLLPEVYAVTAAHNVFARSLDDPSLTAEARRQAAARADLVCREMADVRERIARMDQMGVDVQVLSSSPVHQCTCWAAPQESLKLERALNDYVARVVAENPSRLVGLGGVPLHAPALAVGELKRCITELALKGVVISSTAGDMEIGDRRLWPFWQAAEELGAVVFIHPAGNSHPRFEKWFLWNSVGQNFEETLAIASLMYEGVLEAFPGLKICLSHGGGTMPFCLGRITRNFMEKPATRVNMKKQPAEYLRMLHFDSCIYHAPSLRTLVDMVGIDRVVLGSDYPVGEAKPIEFVRSAPGLSASDQDKIIAANAARLLGLAT